MSNAPKVSVCVATYKQEAYIRECLQSIVSQETKFAFEVLVGDDCSPDNTRSVIEEFVRRYPEKVRAVFQTANVGATNNYQCVQNLASGEYICACDGDDYWLPGKLQHQVGFMDGNPEVVQTWHRQFVVNAQSQIIAKFPKRFPKSVFGGPLRFHDLACSYGLVGQHSSQMMRRSACLIRERDRFTIDYFYALDIASHGHSVHLPGFWGCYRSLPGGSITNTQKGRDEVDIALLDVVDHFSPRFPETRSAFGANLIVRSLGAYFRKRKHWRSLLQVGRQLPFSVTLFLRSLRVFLLHRL